MSNLFTSVIDGWASWSQVFQSIPAFTPLIQAIYAREGLAYTDIEHLTPGTNAVFALGDTVVKIFAPKESTLQTKEDYQTELHGLKRAHDLGIPAPRLLASGQVDDAYCFCYLVFTRVPGQEWGKAVPGLAPAQKASLARELRRLTDRLNTPAAPFNQVDVMNRALTGFRWKLYSDVFNSQRRAYLEQRGLGHPVYVHGDLTPDNLLLDASGHLMVIDFADAVLAPAAYEQALVASEVFDFDPDFMAGYFGPADLETLTETCLYGLLLHDYGGDVIASRLGAPGSFPDLAALRLRLRQALSTGRS